VGNATWTGVRVRDILERAGSRPAAKHLHTFGADKPPLQVPPFHRSLELEKALADGIVAYQMNGAPLPPLHGGPARLVVPGWAGDHWMKWLERLSAQTEPQKGFYMDVGYRYPRTPGEPGVKVKPEEMDPVRELFVKSSITRAAQTATVGAAVEIAGFAFSGSPDIARVEVSDDAGATWSEARLGADRAPYSWRLWSFAYTPKAAGRVTLVARATDGRGAMQPRQAVWNQSGYLYNAWPSAEIEVRA
jgi:DMSO/TMAO reductase YedYZ molybdopterin-dependent catalytic subunit